MSPEPERPAERVLGVDPGSRVTGWGVVERGSEGLRLVGCGTLRLRAEDPIAARLLVLHRGLGALLAEHRPGAVAVEEAFFGRNVRSAIRLAEARAVCLLAAEMAGSGVHELPPALVKKALTGHGRAGKETVRACVLQALGWEAERPPPAYDASDALAIAITTLRRLEAPGGLPVQSVGRRRRGRRWSAADVERLSERS